MVSKASLKKIYVIICLFTQFTSQLENTGAALQFLASVGTDESYHNRPQHPAPSKEELISYTLQQEIMQAAKLGSYSGKNLIS